MKRVNHRPRRRPSVSARKRTRTASLRVARAGMPDLRHSQGFGRRNKRSVNRKRIPYVIIAIGCASLLFIASVVWYLNRDVPIKLNGQDSSVRIGSTIDQLIEAKELDPKPGDLLAVDDSVLEKDAGDPFSVTLDGKKLTGDAMHATELEGGEELVIEDGADVYEDYDAEVTEIQPTVTLEGTGAVQYVKTWGIPGRSEVWTGKQSGITAEPRVTQEVQNCEVVQQSVTPDDKGKYVALTFDEAPSSYTQELLDVLHEKGAKATFFLLGDATDERVAAAKAIADAGCQVGSAGHSNQDLTKLSEKDLRDELSKGFSSVKSATGSDTALFRAPLGAFGVDEWAQSMDLISSNVLWNVDSGDWLLPGADDITSTVVESAQNGNIILLTDNEATGAQVLEALPGIIDGLKEKGFKLVTVSELLATDEDFPEWVVNGTLGMPEDAALPHVSLSDAATEEE